MFQSSNFVLRSQYEVGLVHVCKHSLDNGNRSELSHPQRLFFPLRRQLDGSLSLLNYIWNMRLERSVQEAQSRCTLLDAVSTVNVTILEWPGVAIG